MGSSRRYLGPVAAMVAVFLLCASCSPKGSCAKESAGAGSCADLEFMGQFFNEWREIKPPTILQELGDAAYPSCNAAACGGGDLAGFGATDVWLVDGVAVTQAVIGLREGTHTYVIFVRRGVDPETLRSRIDPALLTS